MPDAPLEIEIAGDQVAGLRCVNCGQREVTAGIMLTRDRDDVVVPEVAQRCAGCGQEGCDA